MRRLLPLVALASCGCMFFTTRNDGEQIKQEVRHLRDQVDRLERDTVRQRDALHKTLSRAQRKVLDMEDTLERATKLLARNSADFGAEMEDMRQEVRALRGALEELSHQVDALETHLRATDEKVDNFALAAGVDLPLPPSRIPQDAAAHKAAIERAFQEGRYGETRALARAYLERKDAPDKDVAQLRIGQAYAAQKRYAKALGALRRFVDTYPQSPHLPQALFDMADAFYNLGDCTDARVLVDTILSKYPRSAVAPKAKALSATMGRSGSRCTS